VRTKITQAGHKGCETTLISALKKREINYMTSLVFILSDNFSFIPSQTVIDMMQYFENFYHIATVASVTQSFSFLRRSEYDKCFICL